MMANPLKGEVAFQALARTFILVFDFNTLVEIEHTFGVGAAELETILGERVGNMRTVFRIGLSRHHPEITDLEAGDVIHDLGTKRAAALIGEAIAKAFPDAQKGGGSKAPARPRKAA